jgi:DNA-binding response OmpR family regulator
MNGITWVLGENAAKSFPVGAGQTVVLMDREEPVMYMKSVDQSGMPLPLRIFDITERTAQHTESVIAKSETPDYVSRSEFDKFKEDVRQTIKNMRKPKNDEVKNNGKPVL